MAMVILSSVLSAHFPSGFISSAALNATESVILAVPCVGHATLCPSKQRIKQLRRVQRTSSRLTLSVKRVRWCLK